MRLTLMCLMWYLVVINSTAIPFNGHQPAIAERDVMFGGYRLNCNKENHITTTPKAIEKRTTTTKVENKTTKRKDKKESTPSNIFFPIYFNDRFPPMKQENPSTAGNDLKPRRPTISIANSFSTSGAATSHSISLN